MKLAMRTRNLLRPLLLAAALSSPAAVQAQDPPPVAPPLEGGDTTPTLTRPQPVHRIDAVSGSRLSPQLRINGENHTLAPAAQLRWEDGTPADTEALGPGMRVRIKTQEAGAVSLITHLTILND